MGFLLLPNRFEGSKERIALILPKKLTTNGELVKKLNEIGAATTLEGIDFSNCIPLDIQNMPMDFWETLTFSQITQIYGNHRLSAFSCDDGIVHFLIKIARRVFEYSYEMPYLNYQLRFHAIMKMWESKGWKIYSNTLFPKTKSSKILDNGPELSFSLCFTRDGDNRSDSLSDSQSIAEICEDESLQSPQQNKLSTSIYQSGESESLQELRSALKSCNPFQ